MVYCAYCYLEKSNSNERRTFPVCGKCKKRTFCSRECQKLDWKTGHKLYCELSGENGFDFQVRECPEGGGDKGLGIFALRDFDKDEKIMVERPIMMAPYDFDKELIPEAARIKVDTLVPRDGNLFEKISRNAMSCGDDKSGGLFIEMSRVNHDCIGNSCHIYMASRGVKLLVATRPISKGEEILFSYSVQTSSESRKHQLRLRYGFTCTCSVCRDSKVEDIFDRMVALDAAILNLGSVGQTDLAMKKGKQLLVLKERYPVGSWSEYRTHYDLFQVAITKRSTLKEAKLYARKAYESVSKFTSDEECEQVKKMKRMVDSPESHPNYLVLG